MLKKLLLGICTSICCIFLSSQIYAQQKTITGSVSNANGNTPIANATVSVKGTNVAVSSSANGDFSISVPDGKTTLVVSSVGFDVDEIDIAGKSSVAIQLKEKAGSLNEVVVTGYTSVRKKDITGAVAVVDVAELKSQPAANAEQQLQGRASGVTVTTNGVPGAGATVRIRGLSSFTSNSPLYVIDGVQAGNIVGLNPNDIESMQVLKDAASASIYGINGSNGVIVITTKKGKKRGLNVAFDMYLGTQDPGAGPYPDRLNAQEEADLFFLKYKNSGLPLPQNVYGNGPTPVLPDYIYYSGYQNTGIPINEGNPNVNPSLYSLDNNKLGDVGYSPYLIVPTSKGGTDWYGALTRSAPIQSYNVTAGNSNENGRILLSMNYFDQQAITNYQFYKRATVRLNSEYSILPGVRIGENLQLFMSNQNVPTDNNTEASLIAETNRFMTTIPLHQIDGQGWGGNLGGPGVGTWGNAKSPVATAYRQRNNRVNDQNIFGNMYLEVDFAKHFTARTSFGGSTNFNNAKSYPFIEYEYVENSSNTTYNESSRTNFGWIWTNQVNYKNTWGKNNLNAVAGVEAQKYGGGQIIGSATGFFNYNNVDFINLGNGSVQNLSGSQTFTPVTLQSYFVNANYAFDDKYLVGATFRRDGSSKFLNDFKYANFSSFSLGWRISHEAFMRDITWINDLKIRGSWGQLGNQSAVPATNAFTSYSSNRQSSFYDIFGTQNSPMEGFYLSFLGNQLGQWETNTNSNIGFDATLFNNSTTIVFDWYHKTTEGLLYNPEVQAIAGAAANQASRNVGSMKNGGIDLAINNRANLSKNVVLNSGIIFTTYTNEVTAIAPGVAFFDYNSPANEANRLGQNATRNVVGQPFNTYFGYKVVGLFQSADDVAKSPTQTEAAPGRFKYDDYNGDGVITSDDRQVIGNPNPDFSYGINLGTEFKSFDLTAFFYGVAGKDNFNFTRWWTDFTPGAFPGGRSKDALYNSWLADGSRPNATTPMAEVNSGASGFSTYGQVNSYYVENASYFRLRNLQLGYTLPVSFVQKAKLSSVRVYIQAANLFTITSYTGLDPEVVTTDDRSSSVDIGAYPLVKQYLFGLNVKF